MQERRGRHDTGVGARLAQARRDAGLTQRELADRVGVRLWTVEQWETGAQAIPAGKVDAIVEATGQPIGAKGEQSAPAAAGTPVVETPAEEIALPVEAKPLPAAETSAAHAKESAPPISGVQHMPLDPDAIRKANLPRSFLNGYEESATRQLLDDIATRVETLLAQRDELQKQATERKRLQQRIIELEEELSSHGDTEQTLSRALLAATRTGEELIKTAEDEATEIREAARKAVEESERQLEEHRATIERERVQLRENLLHEALAATRQDLVQLHDEAQSLLDEHFQRLGEGLRSLIKAGSDEDALLRDISPSQGEPPKPYLRLASRTRTELDGLWGPSPR